ncbi:hypothetical protein [Fuchsiella alkaliacetigena]|uniref:hypothetical protein n=1 Tax=Fuchsiella alkaliacetigena TaxID=957042 RepID=UPI002009E992|nr:hypothetical protein [Fuchsiella alkaliacetigena]MCK8825550.1 hypothetical protein [Fuchsiella alkaliacetigena]
MLSSIQEEEIEEAIDYLAENLPKRKLKKINQKIKNKDTYNLFDFGFGLKVQRLLGKKFDWNDQILFRVWRMLVIKAARKVD